MAGDAPSNAFKRACAIQARISASRGTAGEPNDKLLSATRDPHRTFGLKFRVRIRANSNIDRPSSAKYSHAGSRSLLYLSIAKRREAGEVEDASQPEFLWGR
jgi:hypothetical protein